MNKDERSTSSTESSSKSAWRDTGSTESSSDTVWRDTGLETVVEMQASLNNVSQLAAALQYDLGPLVLALSAQKISQGIQSASDVIQSSVSNIYSVLNGIYPYRVSPETQIDDSVVQSFKDAADTLALIEETKTKILGEVRTTPDQDSSVNRRQILDNVDEVTRQLTQFNQNLSRTNLPMAPRYIIRSQDAIAALNKALPIYRALPLINEVRARTDAKGEFSVDRAELSRINLYLKFIEDSKPLQVGVCQAS